MLKLTAIQRQILEFIKSFMRENQMPPTVREIAEHMGYRSDNAAFQHLTALKRKNMLELEGRARGIRLLEPMGLPIVGQVAAGSPILAEENIEEHINVEANLFTPSADFLLKVRGMSMRDEGILDGDFLAVHSTEHAEQNQIVVARIDEEVTVKRYKRKQNKVTLLPANPEFEPIEIDLREQAFGIEGVMAGLIRNTRRVM